jgi:hypothetical protein
MVLSSEFPYCLFSFVIQLVQCKLNQFKNRHDSPSIADGVRQYFTATFPYASMRLFMRPTGVCARRHSSHVNVYGTNKNGAPIAGAPFALRDKNAGLDFALQNKRDHQRVQGQ